MATLSEALALGRAHHQAGRLPEAEAIYRQILQVDPAQADALHLLGVAALQRGQVQSALDIITQAIQLKPGQADFHNNLGEAYRSLGRNAEAIACYQRALQLQPDDAQALNNLGLVLGGQGRLDEAAACCRLAVQLKPHYAEAHNNLGNALKRQGRLAEAIASYRTALTLEPAHAGAHNNLGLALEESGDVAQAVSCYERALRLRPDLVEAHNNLGTALKRLGRIEEALSSYQTALRLRPDHVEALNNLGTILQQQGRLDEAIDCYRRALHLQPDLAEAHQNLGNTLQQQERLDEAIACFRQALHLQPDLAEAHHNLGDALRGQGRIDEALAAFRTALRLKPAAAHFHSNLVLTLNYHPGYDARAIQEECARWNQQHAEPLKECIRPHANGPDPERRLRIGYVSPDFREHVDSLFTIPLLANHDHGQCEIFCYADVACPDATTERLRGHADVWRDTVGLTDQELADLVRGDRIDILVQLKMHTAYNRLLMFARKPAPVQVAWLAYPGTTGLSAIDYRLTDPYLDPPGLLDVFYAEESLRLPETFWCYDPLSDQPPVNALPAKANGVITFGCLNNFSKVNEECLALWARVLQAVPGSRLLLLAPRDPARERVLAKLQHEAIAASRVEFADKLPRADYLKVYHRIDIALDPLPCNGGTTTLDAFWMGVPTLTLLGKTVVGRAGWSQLCNLGLQELTAETPEQYVVLAARLAGDLSRLEELRGTLRQRMSQSPLMDGKRFARHMEQLYRQMWRRWCHARQPSSMPGPGGRG